MEEQVAQILASLQGAVTELAPEAWAALVVGARVDAILNLVLAAVAIPGSLVWFYYFKRMFEWSEKDDLEPLIVFPSIAIGIAGICGLLGLFFSSTWLGIFYPEAAVIRSLIDAAANQ